eukprot:c16433_g1_i1 orf=269-2872(-)
MDNFWEDQWSQMEAWATPGKLHAQAMNNSMPRKPHSPSASELSFTVSTWDSHSLSAQSEASPIAGKYLLRSPDLSGARIHGIALFNPLFDPDKNHSRSLSVDNVKGEFTKMDKQQNSMLLQERPRLLFENIHLACDLDVPAPLDIQIGTYVKAKESLAKSPVGVVCGTQSLLDKGGLSHGSESWRSALSRELSWNHVCNGADDLDASEDDSSTFYDKIVGIRGGERVWGTVEQEACTRYPFGVNEVNESANRENRKSYAQAKEGISSYDEGCMYKSQSLHSRFDDIRSNISTTKLQCSDASFTSRPCAVGLETRCFHKCKSLDSSGCANNLDLNALSKLQVAYANYGRRAHCVVKGPPKMPEQEGFECGIVRANSKAEQLTLTNIGRSAYAESLSYKKPTHQKLRHSAAVEDIFPSSSLHGYFKFVEQDGCPCFSFSVNDSDEVFLARACKPDSQSYKEHSNCLYTFHSREDDGKVKGGCMSCLKKEKLASNLVGKMVVFDSRCIDGNHTDDGKCFEETHFVLYDERCLDQMSAQYASKSADSGCKSKFSSMPTLCSHSQNLKQRGDCNVSHGLVRSHLHEPISRENMSEQGSDDLEHSMNEHYRTNMELAVIVITTSIKEHKVTRKKANGPTLKERAGWGSTFLEKGWALGFLAKSSGTGSKRKPPVPLEEDLRLQWLNGALKDTCESDVEYIQHRTGSAKTYPKPRHTLKEKLTRKLTSSNSKQLEMAVDVVVILPAGYHGVPRIGPARDEGSYRPTALLDSWKSGGSCDCGGWDMGCGLSVLKAETLQVHEKRATIAVTSRDQIDWISPGEPLKIFTQGYKKKQLLMLEIVKTGLFSLSFQARISPLQAFATAVAIFHQQITLK